jgi:hypothetical protein
VQDGVGGTVYGLFTGTVEDPNYDHSTHTMALVCNCGWKLLNGQDVATAVYDSMFAIAEHHVVTDTTVDYITPTEEDQVDAFADITVFATGDIMKLGYNPEKVLCEVGKEINSRTGEIVNGKFQKYKTPEAMALWYKADFSDCKL